MIILLAAKWGNLKYKILFKTCHMISHLHIYMEHKWMQRLQMYCQQHVIRMLYRQKQTRSRTTSIGVTWWDSITHKTWQFNLFTRPLTKSQVKPVLHVSFATRQSLPGLIKCTVNHVMENNKRLVFQMSFMLPVYNSNIAPKSNHTSKPLTQFSHQNRVMENNKKLVIQMSFMFSIQSTNVNANLTT